MTAQIADVFMLNDREFSIAGVKGGELFNPKSMGLNPIATCTACWRGHVCHYRIKADWLVLDTLQITLGQFEGRTPHLQPGPEINGVKPIAPGGDFAFFNNRYEGLDLRIDFTGGILIGDGFIREAVCAHGVSSRLEI